MIRREVITLLGGAAVWPALARAQQPQRMRRVGVLVGFGESDPQTQSRLSAFRERLQELGWIDGRNVEIIYRWSAGDHDRIRNYAAELAKLAPDVILAHSPPVVAALQRATRTIPVVFVQVTGAVDSGFVSNMARPDGNITGFETFELEMSGKWLDLLKELKPDVTRIAVLHDPDNPAAQGRLRVLDAVAPSAAVRLIAAGVHQAQEIERAIVELAREPHGGLVVLPDNVNVIHRERIVALANEYRLPAIYPFRYFATAGGVMSYGTDLIELYRTAASYVDRILKGARPADLPVQAPTKYELVVNLKTAKALGIEVPTTLLSRADEVIE